MSHTREPWSVEECDYRDEYYFKDGYCEVGPALIGGLSPDNKADAYRIAACVNACKGISNQALEDGVVAELLEALNEMVVAMRLYQMDFDDEPPYRHRAMMERAEAAIAKTKGQQP